MKNKVLLLSAVLSMTAFSQDINTLINERKAVVKKIKRHDLRSKLVSKKSVLKQENLELERKLLEDELKLADAAIINGKDSDEYVKLQLEQDEKFSDYAKELLSETEEISSKLGSIEDVTKEEVCESCLANQHSEEVENFEVDTEKFTEVKSDKVTLADRISTVGCHNSGLFPKKSFRLALYKASSLTGKIEEVDASEIEFKNSMKVGKASNGSLIFVDGNATAKVEYISMCTIYKRGRKLNKTKMKTDDKVVGMQYQLSNIKDDGFEGYVNLHFTSESNYEKKRGKRKGKYNIKKRYDIFTDFSPYDLSVEGLDEEQAAGYGNPDYSNNPYNAENMGLGFNLGFGF